MLYRPGRKGSDEETGLTCEFPLVEKILEGCTAPDCLCGGINPLGLDSVGTCLPPFPPIDEPGTLFGTLEIGDASGFNGQTSEAPADPEVPQFEPDRAPYELPPADVDSLGTVDCEE